MLKSICYLTLTALLLCSCQSPRATRSTASKPVEQEAQSIEEISSTSIKAKNTSPELNRTEEISEGQFNRVAINPFDLKGEKIHHNFPPIYFAFNSSAVESEHKNLLKTLAHYIHQNPSFHLVINGHCDEQGSNEYNRILSEKRAMSVRELLQKFAPIASRLHTVGYGEESLAQIGSSATAHAANRRANFDILSIAQ